MNGGSDEWCLLQGGSDEWCLLQGVPNGRDWVCLSWQPKGVLPADLKLREDVEGNRALLLLMHVAARTSSAQARLASTLHASLLEDQGAVIEPLEPRLAVIQALMQPRGHLLMDQCDHKRKPNVIGQCDRMRNGVMDQSDQAARMVGRARVGKQAGRQAGGQAIGQAVRQAGRLAGRQASG